MVETTKKIRINLVAMTRLEYSEVLEVPRSMRKEDLYDLVENRYEAVDAEAYCDDQEYWEQGHCAYERAGVEDAVTGVVSIDSEGNISVNEIDSQLSVVANEGVPQTTNNELKMVIQKLLEVLHPGVVGLIHNNHGKEACDKACVSITNAKNAIADE